MGIVGKLLFITEPIATKVAHTVQGGWYCAALMIWKQFCRILPPSGIIAKTMAWPRMTLSPAPTQKSGGYVSMAITGNPPLKTGVKVTAARTATVGPLYKASMTLQLYSPDSLPNGITGRMTICCLSMLLPAQTRMSGGKLVAAIIGGRLSVIELRAMAVRIVQDDLHCRVQMIWTPFPLNLFRSGIMRKTSILNRVI